MSQLGKSIGEADREEVFGLIEQEIMGCLHDGNVARFKVRPRRVSSVDGIAVSLSKFEGWHRV
jgi:hypothetical protein